MDRFNVIDITTDLDVLNNDMVAWSSLPFHMRLRSDEECIRRYNMTNTDLYKRLKALIIAHHLPEEDFEKTIGGLIAEGFEYPEEFATEEDKDFSEKMELVEYLEQNPNIVIICPFRKKDEKDYCMSDLLEKYNKYCMLTLKNKRFSDAYSINIWGYNVINMFDIMKKHIETLEGFDDEEIVSNLSTNISEYNMVPVEDLCNKRILENDIIGLLNIKLDACSTLPMREFLIYESMKEKIDDHIYHRDFMDSLRYTVPFLTVDEAYEHDIDSDKIEDYYPNIEMNEENCKLARERQNKWLSEHSPMIIDVTKLKSNDSLVLESTTALEDVYKQNDLYPIYIVLSYNGTKFNKAVRLYTHSRFSHAGISIGSDMRNIASYNKNGFVFDKLKDYTDIYNNSELMVLAMFMKKIFIDKIKEVFKDFTDKKSTTKYGYSNLFNLLFQKGMDFDPNRVTLICSQFVDLVFRTINIKLFEKPNNLVSPEDFAQLQNRPKIYKVYDGLTKDYNERKVQNIIFNLFKSNSSNRMDYNDTVYEASQYTLESYFCETENEKANEVLREIRSFLKPESIFVDQVDLLEFKFPISIKKNGDVEIQLYKSLEQQYQEAHRLLKTYGDKNIEGIKHELARLFYINCAIEKKIKKMDKANENYKKFIDLRARVLNDFKKYFKIVMEAEPDFDFAEYFKKSEYYNGSIIIDGSIIRAIKKFLESLGN